MAQRAACAPRPDRFLCSTVRCDGHRQSAGVEFVACRTPPTLPASDPFPSTNHRFVTRGSGHGGIFSRPLDFLLIFAEFGDRINRRLGSGGASLDGGAAGAVSLSSARCRLVGQLEPIRPGRDGRLAGRGGRRDGVRRRVIVRRPGTAPIDGD